MTKLDRTLIEKDALDRGVLPQFHDGEEITGTCKRIEENIEVYLVSATSEDEWLKSAYNVVIASWVQKPILNATREEMVKTIKYEKFATVPYEAFTATFAVSGLSRQITHQWVRHRTGGYFQESFRNTDLRTHNIRIPESIANDINASFKYRKTIEELFKTYKDLVDIYKIPYEDARAIMPMGTCTYLGATGNLRYWVDYWKARTSEIVQPEHGLIVKLMMEKFKEKRPIIWDIIKERIG